MHEDEHGFYRSRERQKMDILSSPSAEMKDMAAIMRLGSLASLQRGLVASLTTAPFFQDSGASALGQNVLRKRWKTWRTRQFQRR